MASTHSSRLERWLGKQQVELLSSKMRGFHGPDPIPVANVPGKVFACNDGDFCGTIRGGYVATAAEYYANRLTRAVRKLALNPSAYTGFASLSDMVSEATAGGKMQKFIFSKTGVTGVANIANTLWDVGTIPSAGSTSAAPGGSSPDNTTTGGLKQDDPSGSDTLHFLNATVVGTQSNNCLLLYDRFFQVNHNIATDPQTVSGTPGRYQSTLAKNSFITVAVTTALGAGTPTYTITYVDQDGNTAEAAAAQTIVGSAIARRFPFAASVGNGWHIPLNSGDTGVRSITDLNLSAASTGNVDVVLCKPLVLIPILTASQGIMIDGLNTAFNLVKIEVDACLAFMELNKGSTTATSYIGEINLLAG